MIREGGSSRVVLAATETRAAWDRTREGWPRSRELAGGSRGAADSRSRCYSASPLGELFLIDLIRRRPFRRRLLQGGSR